MGKFADLIGVLQNTFKIGRSTISSASLTVPRTATLPDKTGTFAFLDDVGASGYAGLRGVSGTTDAPTATDEGGLIGYTSVDPVTVTIDASILTPLRGFDLIAGEGLVTLVPEAGTDFIPAGPHTLRAEGSGASVVCLGSDKVWIIGDLESGAPSGGAGGEYGAVREVSTTADTPVDTDVGDLIKCTNAAATTITAASGDFVEGQWFDVVQAGAGQVTIVADTGVTLLPTGSQALRAQGSGVSVVYLGDNEFWVVGDVEVAGGGSGLSAAAVHKRAFLRC